MRKPFYLLLSALALAACVPVQACGGAPAAYEKKLQAIATPLSPAGAIPFPKPTQLICALSFYETLSKPKLAAAVDRLDPNRPFTEWREALADLSEAGAQWTLAVALSHPDPDVRITAARALRAAASQQKPPAPVQVRFILEVVKSAAVIRSGSEEATLHGIYQHELAALLNALTGASVSLRSGQDSEGLKLGIAAWEKALNEQISRAGVPAP